MIIGSLNAHDTIKAISMGEYIFNEKWDNTELASNRKFIEADRLIDNPAITDMLPAVRGTDIFKSVFGSQYSNKFRLDFTGGRLDHNINHTKLQKEVFTRLDELGAEAWQMRETIMWVCVFEYGTPTEYEESGVKPTETKLTEITYGMARKKKNYFLGGVYSEARLDGWVTLGNSWYKATKSENGGRHTMPYWFSAVNQYRDETPLDYNEVSIDYDDWNDRYGSGEPYKQLLSISLWTLSPRKLTKELGVFNWWW